MSRRLIAYIVLCGFCFTLTTAALFISREYGIVRDRKRMDRELIRTGYVPAVASSLYKMDTDQLLIDLESLKRLPTVRLVHVEDELGGTFRLQLGSEASAGTVEDFELLHQVGSTTERIGALRVGFVVDRFYGGFRRSILTMLLTAAAMGTVLTAAFIYTLDRLVVRHLLAIADFARGQDFDTVGAPLRLSRERREPDELDALVDSLNTMLARIERDREERDRLQQQLRQAQKMESIGTLAGGVAHDFNNILSAIMGYAQLSLMKLPKDEPVRAYIEQVLDAANRAAHLTHDLLLFSRKQPISRNPIDLNAGIRRLSKMLVRIIGEDIALELQLAAGSLTVLADMHQLDQVLMNLATNARDAMPAGGRFLIVTELVQVDATLAAASHLARSGPFVRVTVADTGAGMDEQTRLRVFEPFFTTKEPGKGTGLGLAVVYGIVAQHEGAVTVESAPGRGTTFSVYLPSIPSEPEAAPPLEAEAPPGGTETILLAEDNAAVRDVTEQVLQGAGYSVITAVDGEDAVRKFSQNRGDIDLLLFDLVMPRMGGREAYARIRQLGTGVRVIFASGYDSDTMPESRLSDPPAPLLRKPMEIGALLKAVRDQLDEAGRS